MKETKYKDVRVGSRVFTCRLDRWDDDFGINVNISVFEYHDIPINSWQRFVEKFKYEYYASAEWNSCLSDCTLDEYLLKVCEMIAETKEDAEKAKAEWKNI